MYGNNGDLISRSVYKYSDHQVESLHYSEDGRLNSRSLAVLDDNGNEVEKTYFDAPLKGENHVYRYAYEFDDHGNWTKRTATAFYVIGGVSKLDSSYVTYRRITYY
jgi:hypothetical protein